jgi:ABC-2 type transport system permease protein
MTTVISAELFKLRSTRTPWVVALTLTVLIGAIVAANATLLGTPGQPALEPANLGQLARAPGRLAASAALLFGLLLTTAEYRHGTVITTRLAHPRLSSLVPGKAIAAALAGSALALLVEAVMVASAAAVLAARGVAVEPLGHGVPGAVVSAILVSAMYAVIGVGVGELLRNPALAIGVVLGWTFVVEGVMPVVMRAPDLARWLPGGATDSALSLGATNDGTRLAPAVGLAVLGAYTVALLSAGAGRSTRSDP